MVLGCLMFGVGAAAGFGGLFVAAFGGMAHVLSTETSNVDSVTETWCDRCDFQSSIEVWQFSHSDGDRCMKQRCAGTLHIQSRAMTTQELAKVKKDTEAWVAGTETVKHIGGAAALSGGLMLLAGLMAMGAWFGLNRRRQWGRIVALVVIVPAIASVVVAGTGHAIMLTVMAPLPVLFKKWQREWKMDLIESFNPEWKDLYKTII